MSQLLMPTVMIKMSPIVLDKSAVQNVRWLFGKLSVAFLSQDPMMKPQTMRQGTL